MPLSIYHKNAERRQRLRHELAVAAEVEVGDRGIGTSVLDLSAEGARVAMSRAFALPSRLVLHLYSIGRVEAEVRWQDRDELGLCFAERRSDIDDALTAADSEVL